MEEEKALDKKHEDTFESFLLRPFSILRGMKYRRSCDSTGDGEGFKRAVHSSSPHTRKRNGQTRWREGRKANVTKCHLLRLLLGEGRRLVRVAVKFLCFRIEDRRSSRVINESTKE